MHLNHKYLLRFWILLFYFSSLSSQLFSQKANFAFNYEKQLLSLKEEITTGKFSPITQPCNISYALAVEDLCRNALLLNKAGDWQCCTVIFDTLFKTKSAFTPLQLCHLNLAWAEFLTLHQNYVPANFYASTAYNEASKREWANEKAQALWLLSLIGLNKSNISSAYSWADSALIITRQTGNQILEEKVLFQLGLCIRRNFTAVAKKAFPYFLMARNKALARGDSLTAANIDFYIGSDNFELNNWQVGLRYFQEGMRVVTHKGDYYQKYLANIALGYAFQRSDLPREALTLFTSALLMSKRQQQPYDIQHCYHDMARNYQALHQYDSALIYANLAANVPGVDSLWANVWDTKSGIYEGMGNYKLANEMNKKSVEWYHKYFLYRSLDQFSGFEIKLRTKEQELQEIQQKRLTIKLVWIIGFIIVLLLVAGFAFILQRNAKQKLFLQNSLIQKQSIDLEKSLNEKEILLKEIHHRVKNNLTVISNLLELQGNNITDETAKAAIATGQNRVTSIALIHQRLYQHENLAAIDLKGFLEDLVLQVSTVLKKPAGTVDLKFNVPETLLDIDTAVPLGLIMNELLTNSYKYAFTNGCQGLIEISLRKKSPGDFSLTYFDNGPGISNKIDIKQPATLGLRLIQRLSKQIGGSATYRYQNGSTFIINFQNSNIRNQE